MIRGKLSFIARNCYGCIIVIGELCNLAVREFKKGVSIKWHATNLSKNQFLVCKRKWMYIKIFV